MALKHVKAGGIIGLQRLGEKLPGARTAALAKTETFEAIRLIIPAGRDIAPHEVPGPITLHCLEGRTVLELPDASVELSAGECIYLDGGVRHALKGLENSFLLLTILFVR